MKAALLREPGRIDLIEIETPEPGPGQLLLRVAATSICGSDLSGYRGVNPRMRLPTIPGHEIAGTVIGIGPGAPSALDGVLVVVEPNISCGGCEWCAAGLPNICPQYRVLGEASDVPGGLAEYVVVAADQVYRLPSGLSAAEGAVIQPLSIAYHGVVTRGQVREGESVLVLGAGPIGLAAQLVASNLGARVIVADVVNDRLEVARRLGAFACLRADTNDFASAVRELTGGSGADVTVEAVGGTQDETIVSAVQATAMRGRIVILGTFAQTPQSLPAYAFKNREQTIIGSHGHPRTFAPTIDLISEGRLRPADLITHRLPLDDVAEAFRLLDTRSDGVIKVVLKPVHSRGAMGRNSLPGRRSSK